MLSELSCSCSAPSQEDKEGCKGRMTSAAGQGQAGLQMLLVKPSGVCWEPFPALASAPVTSNPVLASHHSHGKGLFFASQ